MSSSTVGVCSMVTADWRSAVALSGEETASVIARTAELASSATATSTMMTLDAPPPPSVSETPTRFAPTPARSAKMAAS